MTTLKGFTHFYSETGTEGGYWAFQDSAYIKPNTTRFACKKCNAYWDKERHPDESPRKDCPHNWQPVSKEDWSYEGLHVLENGDYLTIYAPNSPNRVVWSGFIQRSEELIDEGYKGWRIHFDQVGIPRDEWGHYFEKSFPAKLVLAPNKP